MQSHESLIREYHLARFAEPWRVPDWIPPKRKATKKPFHVSPLPSKRLRMRIRRRARNQRKREGG